MPQRKGLLAPQNTFLDTIATRFDGTHSNFVLGNAQAKENPIVYCSDGFCELTHYQRSIIMSRNCSCSFLWGPATSDDQRQKIEDSIKSQNELKIEVIFYKMTGCPFVCLLDIVPIKNEKSQVVLFLVSHKDITREKMKRNELSENLIHELKQYPDYQEEILSVSESGSVDKMPCPKFDDYRGHRRRSRAVLYQLQGYFDKPRNQLRLKRQFSTIAGKKVPEYKVEKKKKSYLILSHYGIFKIVWDWLILLCTFYIAIMVPYNAAFFNSKKPHAAEIFVEMFFIMDIILNFRTTYVDKSGKVIFSSRLIAINYIKGWFILDLLAAIPFDEIVAVVNKMIYSTNQENELTPHLSLLKLARLLRLARLLQKVERYSQYGAVVLGLMMSTFALCAHWLACIWYVIGVSEMNNDSTWRIGWLFDLSEKIEAPYLKSGANLTGGPTKDDGYITALYFTCSSLTSVGFGNVCANTNKEKIFSICAMLIGALMHALVFGNVTAIIQRMYARRAAFQTKTRDLKDFTRTHHIPKPLKQRMQEFFQTMWSINRGIDPATILHDFPEELRGDVAIHLHREVLSLPIFENASHGCLKLLAQNCLKSIFCTPGETLIHPGDALKYIYLVCNGSLEIREGGDVVALLGKGDLFGTDLSNIAYEPLIRSKCEVKSLTYCDLQCIEISGLLKVLDQYPEFQEHFNEDLVLELSFNIKDGSNRRMSLSVDPTNPNPPLPSISEDDEIRNEETATNRLKQLDDEVIEFEDNLINEKRRTSLDDAAHLLSNNRNSSNVPLTNDLMEKSVLHSSLSNLRLKPECSNFSYSSASQRITNGGTRPRRRSIESYLKRPLQNTSDSVDSLMSLATQSELRNIRRNVQKLDHQVESLRSSVQGIAKNMEALIAHLKHDGKLDQSVLISQCLNNPMKLNPEVKMKIDIKNCDQYDSNSNQAADCMNSIHPSNSPAACHNNLQEKFLSMHNHSKKGAPNTLTVEFAHNRSQSPFSYSSSGFLSNNEDLSPYSTQTTLSISPNSSFHKSPAQLSPNLTSDPICVMKADDATKSYTNTAVRDFIDESKHD